MKLYSKMSVHAQMVVFAAFLVVSICGVAMYISATNNSDVAPVAPVAPVADVTQENLIGGERGAHGCLGPAGYSWDEDANACIRTWELSEIQKQAAGVAVEYVGSEDGVTIIRVQENEGTGCFTVEVEKGTDRTEVTIVDYKVVSADTVTNLN